MTLNSFLASVMATAIVWFARLVTAVRAIWDGVEPVPSKRVYYANHTSNGDFVLIWTVLPPNMRKRTRPVAAPDYWLTSKLRAFIGREVFNAVLIEKPRSIVSLLVSGVLATWGGLIFLRLLQADIVRQEQLTMADVGQSFQMVAASIVIYLVGSILVSFLSWPDVKAAMALESPAPH